MIHTSRFRIALPTYGMALITACVCILSSAAEVDEFKIKRPSEFAFTEKPTVIKKGDQATIQFTTKSFCDVTIAIEIEGGRIVRHLASGVLGENAPAPFQKGSLKQTVVWDGKDDEGRYVENVTALTARVSLGLKPRFERTLFWSPQKRVGISNRPLIAPAPEGVYVHEGEGVDILRLYDHEGNYLRTVYPFPSDKLKTVKGLDWKTFPQSGKQWPIKQGPKHHATLLTSGDSMLKSPGKYGAGGSTLAVHGNRIALSGLKLGRLATDGSSGPFDVRGPQTSFSKKDRKGKEVLFQPRSSAFSPDGKWLYVTGFPVEGYWFHGVCRVAYDAESDAKPEVFVGKMDIKAMGKGPNQFHAPTSLACDAKGRVYVTDFMNDRIQVFTPDAKLFKSIPLKKPALIQIHHKTQELYVFSYFQLSRHIPHTDRIKARFLRLGPVEDPKVRTECPLPLNGYTEHTGLRWDGFHYSMALDSYTEPATIWLVPGKPGTTEQLEILRGRGGDEAMARKSQMHLLIEKNGKLVQKRDFGTDIIKAVKRTKPQVHSKQRLFVHPLNHKLYVAEGDSGVNKSFKQLVEIDPATGQVKLVDLPLTAEDLCFGIDGLVYLRTDVHVVRYDFKTWREVPFDYGEEHIRVGFDGSVKTTSVVSCLVLPSKGRPAWFHMGGMGINKQGHLAVACFNRNRKEDRRAFSIDGSLSKKWASAGGRNYTPPIYPGRHLWGEVHVWDKHGKIIYEDAIPGLGVTDGVAIDEQDNLYALMSAERVYEGKPYFLPWTETWFKMAPKKGKLLATDRTQVPLPKEAQPKRSPDMQAPGVGKIWLEGKEWAYGGVGFGSRPGGCVCWHARASLDYFARSFVPEVDHFSIGVLDTNGNLITRIGTYGNVDEGKPLIAAGGPKDPQSIGGDEVALFHAAYVGTHTDRRLFISDAGNRRILSVKLGYHHEERVALKPAGLEK